ncbi:MAG: DNA repair protein RadC [Prevotellaceae bacterium]|jgi:DNA repair protein RadC|nr:DNA repair protein RadC [Prevotellaceae bacterium]
MKLKEWNKDDRPREKLMLKGSVALSDAELIAILLRSGTREQTVIDLARHVLSLANNSLAELGKIDLKQFQAVKGIGLTKGATLLAALELGRRRAIPHTEERPAICKAMDVQNIMEPILSDLTYEEFWALALNQAGRLIDKKKVGHGGLSATPADIRIVFKFALDNLATQLFLVHNHPSGEKFPSKDDITLTLHMQNAGDMLNIKIVDHIIIAGKNYFSFKEEGLL